MIAYNNSRRCCFAIVLEVRLPLRGAIAFPNFLLDSAALFFAQPAQIGFEWFFGRGWAGAAVVSIRGLRQSGLIRQI